MKRTELEHVIRAAGAIAQSKELVVIGSQAILGMYPQPPADPVVSQEAEIYPIDDPSKSDLIDGSIGELSPFHEQFGYYAHGVAPETAILPPSWRTRVVRIQNENTGGVAALCLHPIDLAINKLIAGRQKDLDFVNRLIDYQLLSIDEIEAVLPELPSEYSERARTLLRKH